jgi:prepilin-type N-terminal cleavage/methylation domain-containing protein
MLKKQNGFSLVEAIVVVVLIAIAVLFITNSIINSMMLNKSNQERFNAIALAQKLTEDIQIRGAKVALQDAKDLETSITPATDPIASISDFAPDVSQDITTLFNNKDYTVTTKLENDVANYDTGKYVQQGFVDYVNVRKTDTDIVVSQSNNLFPQFLITPLGGDTEPNKFSIVIDGMSFKVFNGALSQNRYTNANLYGQNINSIRVENASSSPVEVNLYNTNSSEILNAYYYKGSPENLKLNIKYDLQKVVLRAIDSNLITSLQTAHQEAKSRYTLIIKDSGKELYRRTIMSSH